MSSLYTVWNQCLYSYYQIIVLIPFFIVPSKNVFCISGKLYAITKTRKTFSRLSIKSYSFVSTVIVMIFSKLKETFSLLNVSPDLTITDL